MFLNTLTEKIEANCKITFCSGIINLLFDGLVYNTIIECNLCALKTPNGETRRRNKRSCGKCILRVMYARDTLEQAYPGKYRWRDLCKIYSSRQFLEFHLCSFISFFHWFQFICVMYIYTYHDEGRLTRPKYR